MNPRLKLLAISMLALAGLASAQEDIKDKALITGSGIDRANDWFVVGDASTTGTNPVLRRMKFSELVNVSGMYSTLEPALGNPAQNGYVLSSTTSGTRSWVAMNSDLTSGPVTSSAGVSAIADGAIAPAKITGISASGTTVLTGTAAQARTGLSVGTFLDPLGYFPKSNRGDILQYDGNGSLHVYSGQVWLPLGASTTPAQYATYVSAVEAITTPVGWSDFKGRYLAFLHGLSDAGVLDALVDGAYYGTDGNLSSGAPLAFSGTAAATSTGSFTRSLRGLLFDQSDTQTVKHTIAGLATGSVVYDAAYNHVGTSNGATLTHYTRPLQLSDGTNSNLVRFGSEGGAPSMLVLVNSGVVAQSAQSAATLLGRLSWFRNRDRQTTGIDFGGGSPVTCHIDGMPSTPTTAVSYTGANLTTVEVGFKVNTSQNFQGWNLGWMVFNRRLTTSEHQAVARAWALLDPRSVNLLIEGDSTSQAQFALEPTKNGRTHWPDQMLDQPGITSSVRIAINGADSGHTVASMLTQFPNQISPNIMKGKRNVLVLWGGINDAPTRTAAAIYADLVSIARSARKLGCEVVCATLAKPTGAYESVYEGLNTLIRAGYTNGDFDIFVDVDAAIPSHNAPYDTLWVDSAHLNGAGNAIVAQLFADAILD